MIQRFFRIEYENKEETGLTDFILKNFLEDCFDLKNIKVKEIIFKNEDNE